MFFSLYNLFYINTYIYISRNLSNNTINDTIPESLNDLSNLRYM